MVYFEVITIITFNCISTLACIWLFYQFFSLSRKTLAVKMIFILSVSDFLFHLTNILTMWTFSQEIQNIIIYLLNSSVIFSVLWAASIAYMVYKMLSLDPINPIRYYKLSLLGIIFLSLLLGVG